jgi:hypothetical protein
VVVLAVGEEPSKLSMLCWGLATQIAFPMEKTLYRGRGLPPLFKVVVITITSSCGSTADG